MAETASLDPQTVGRHALRHETPATAQTEVMPVVPQAETLAQEPSIRGRHHRRPTFYFPTTSIAALTLLASVPGGAINDEGAFTQPPEAAAPYVANIPGSSNETPLTSGPQATGKDIAELHNVSDAVKNS